MPTLSYTDGRGNLNGIGTTSYAYTSENRLTLAQPSGAATALRYDLGGRLWQVTKGANVTRFDYSGSALLAELDGTTGSILSIQMTLIEIHQIIKKFGLGLDGT